MSANFLSSQRLRERLGAAAGVCAYGMAALTILGIAGAVWPLADLINNFAPFWAALSVLGAAVAGILSDQKRLRALSVYIAAFAWNTWLIAPEFIRPAPAASDAPALRVIAFNVFGFRSSLQPTLDYLRRAPADFVVLSEVDERDRAALETLRAVYPYWTRCVSAPDCQVLILSKWRPVKEGDAPVLNWRDFGADASPRWAEAAYVVSGAPVRLIGVHLATFRFANRRQQELAALARTARASPTDMIIAGDFNATPWSFTLRRFHQQSGLQPLSAPVASWPSSIPNSYGLQSPIPYLAIDHVYAGPNWRITQLARGPKTRSDHFPIEARFVRAPVNAR